MPKPIIWCALLLALSIPMAQTEAQTPSCKETPYQIGASAVALMKSYQDLIKNTGTNTCGTGGPTVTRTMNGAGYSTPPLPGMVSFASFYRPDSSFFRTIWGGDPGNFTYYGACVPNPILFSGPAIAQNHVYEARLIPVTDYQAATGNKTYAALKNIGVIPSRNVTAIENIRLEPTTGYINRTESAAYNAPSSSKGLVCDVTIKGKPGKTPCYILNNYDGTGTLVWKEKRDCADNCCLNFDKPGFTAGTTYNKPSYMPGTTLFSACGFSVDIGNLVIGTTPYFNMGRIEAAPANFGSGNVFNTNNTTLLFERLVPGGNLVVTFDYLDMGGTENLSVNGVLHKGQLSAAPANLGGASVAVSAGTVPGGKKGQVTLRGNIQQFSVGGQEFYLDNICWRVEDLRQKAAVTAWAANRLDVFVQGTDDALYTKSWDGSKWSGYTQLGNNGIAETPAAVSWGANRIDVFVQGTDKALYTKSWDGSKWSGYTQLGPEPIAGTPAVVSWGPNRIDVFVRGTDDALWTKSWDGSKWSGYTQLGNNKILGTPVAVSWAPNRIDVFVQGTDKALYTKSWDGSKWSAYVPLGSEKIEGSPAVVSWGPNRLDVFVRGTDDALYTKSWNGSKWSSYTQLGNNKILGTPSAVSWGANRIDVFVRGTDDALYAKSWNGSTWSGYTQLGNNKILGTPAVKSWGPNRIDVFVQGTDKALYTKSWDGSKWSGYVPLGSEQIK